VDLLEWILRSRKGGSLDGGLELYDQLVRVGEEWIDLEQVLLGLPNERTSY
jgi:hypothetical protein